MVCDTIMKKDEIYVVGLNPTFSGIWSATKKRVNMCQYGNSLNPTFSGIWSATFCTQKELLEFRVLILLFLEYGLRLRY